MCVALHSQAKGTGFSLASVPNPYPFVARFPLPRTDSDGKMPRELAVPVGHALKLFAAEGTQLQAVFTRDAPQTRIGCTKYWCNTPEADSQDRLQSCSFKFINLLCYERSANFRNFFSEGDRKRDCCKPFCRWGNPVASRLNLKKS